MTKFSERVLPVWLMFFTFLIEPWIVSLIPGPSNNVPEEDFRTEGLFITSGSEVNLEDLTTEQIILANMHLSQFAPTDRPPTQATEPAHVNGDIKDNEVKTPATGSGSQVENVNADSKGAQFADHVIDKLPQQYAKTTKLGLPENDSLSGTKWLSKVNLTTASLLDVLMRHPVPTPHMAHVAEGHLPPSFSHEHLKSQHSDTQTDRPMRKGPYFRPPSAISKKYRNIKDMETLNSACWPRCSNYTVGSSAGANKRGKRKHNSYRQKFYNYKLLYDTLKRQGDIRRQETEFYAWIFGATMLTLGSLTTLASCIVFCFCGEKWRKRRQTRRFDKSGQYQRVDSVSSMVDSHLDPLDHQEQLDSVTII